MAKKKTAPKAKPQAKTIAFKVSDPYAEWVEKVAARNRSTVAGLIDQALAQYAASIGVKEEAPAR
jgi:hypothetical protein